LIIGALAFACALSTLILWTRIDLSFGGVMDRSHPEVARYFAASERYGLGGRLPLLIEGPEPALDDAVEAVAWALREEPRVRSVARPIDDDWTIARLPYLVDRETFDLWTAQLARPTATGGELLEERLEARRSESRSQHSEGARLVLVTLARDSFESDLDTQDFPLVQRRTSEVLAPFGATGRFAGMPAIVHQDQEATLGRIRLLSIASLLAALLLILRIERRPLGLVAIAAPMILATGATLGIVGAITGRITLMESIFSVMIFGLGIDFAVHLLLRVQEATDAGASLAQALQTSLSSAGPGVVAGALTTAGAFAMIAFAPDASFFHLGLAGAIGITLCLVFALALLPAAWVLLGRRRGPPASATRRSIWTRALGSVITHARRSPRLHLGLAAGLVIASLTGASRFHYESDLRRVVNRQVDAIEVAEIIHDRFGEVPTPWVLPAEDLAHAHALADSLAGEPAFGHIRSAADLIPLDTAQRRAALDQLSPEIERALAGPPELAALAKGLADAREAGPPTLADLPDALADQLVSADGRPLVYAFPSTPHMSSELSAIERTVARTHSPEATSMGALIEVLIGAERPWAGMITALVAAFVGLLLLVDLRRISWLLLAVTPICIGTALTFGALCWTGTAFNTVTVLGLPLVIGLGVDDGIHIVHRMRATGDSDHEQVRAITGVARAIGTTTATTSASFAVLLASGHPGMESLAVVMLIGLPVCLWASISTLPALAVLLRLRA